MIFQPQKKSPSASETEEGLMSAADKKKLNGITVSADSVEFSQALTSGTIVGYITINGNKYTLYAPTNTDTKYSVMGGATSSAAGAAGLVPAPAAGKQASFLRGDGTWVVPTNTTYSANTGIKLNGTTFQHTNAVTAGTAQGDASKTLTFGGTFTIPTVTYDAQGHITGKGTTTMTMPANPNTWRGIQNNLTSDSTTDSLSAAQGKVLKGLVDGKAASSHTHDDRYYTESEVDTKLNGKAATSHGNHVPATQTANNAVFLRNDNTWQTVTPANIGAAASSHTHSAMKGATSSAAGAAGLVPAPAAGDQEKFLRGDGTWQEVSGGGSGGSSGDSLPLSGGVVTGNVQQSGATTDYTTYKFRNIGFGTTTTPTSNSTYGGSGSIYLQY